MIETIVELLRQSGLALAAACSPSLTLLVVSVLAHQQLLVPTLGFELLTSDAALAGAGGLVVVTLVATQVRAMRSVLGLLEWPLVLTTGAIAFAAQPSAIAELHPGAALATGALLAGLAATMRIPLRLLGVLPTVRLLVESLAGLVLLATALAAPLLLPFVLVIGCLAVWLVWRLACKAAARFGVAVGEHWGPLLQSLLGVRVPAERTAVRAVSQDDWLADGMEAPTSRGATRGVQANDAWLQGRW